MAKWTITIVLNAIPTDIKDAVESSKEIIDKIPSNDEVNIITVFKTTTHAGRIATPITISYNDVQADVYESSQIYGKTLGDPETLKTIFKDICTNYPADRHAVFFWDHGGIGGIGGEGLFDKGRNFQLWFDSFTGPIDVQTSYLTKNGEVEPEGKELIIQEIVEIINEGFPLGKVDLLGFCGCDMMLLEHLPYFRDMAKYCVACPSPISITGFDFENILVELKNNFNVTTDAFARRIVELNYNYQVNLNDTFVNHTAIDCAPVLIDDVITSYNALLELLSEKINLQLAVYARNKCLSYTDTYYYETGLIDAIGFAKSFEDAINEIEILLGKEHPQKSDAADKNSQFMKSLHKTILLNKALPSFLRLPDGARSLNAHGISMYFPDTIQQLLGFSHALDFKNAWLDQFHKETNCRFVQFVETYFKEKTKLEMASSFAQDVAQQYLKDIFKKYC
jgi:hypothetical protein